MKPEHFDVLGILSFTYITGFVIWAAITEVVIPQWALAILGLIGVAGIFIDCGNVFEYVFKKKK